MANWKKYREQKGYEDSIRAFIPNEFGIYASKFLISKALPLWNTDNFTYIFPKNERKKPSNLFNLFKEIFPIDTHFMIYILQFKMLLVFTTIIFMHSILEGLDALESPFTVPMLKIMVEEKQLRKRL